VPVRIQVGSGSTAWVIEWTLFGVWEGNGEGEGEVDAGRKGSVGEGLRLGSGDASLVGSTDSIAVGALVSLRTEAFHRNAKYAITPISPTQSIPKIADFTHWLRVIAIQHITEHITRQIVTLTRPT
jgi:hypothetical protein